MNFINERTCFGRTVTTLVLQPRIYYFCIIAVTIIIYIYLPLEDRSLQPQSALQLHHRLTMGATPLSPETEGRQQHLHYITENRNIDCLAIHMPYYQAFQKLQQVISTTAMSE